MSTIQPCLSTPSECGSWESSSLSSSTLSINSFTTGELSKKGFHLSGWLSSLIRLSISFQTCRYPSVRINSLVVQLISLPIGRLCARVLPTRIWKTPFGSFTLNPGPFNVKEHTLVTIMSNVTYQGAYATDILAAQKVSQFQSCCGSILPQADHSFSSSLRSLLLPFE